MYVPKAHQETDAAVLHALIGTHPLGTWVTLEKTEQGKTELVANHIPFLLDDRGMHGTLTAHVARANPVWKQDSSGASIITFQGVNSYFTPSWYPGKHAHGIEVPTWNYAVVHVYGTPAFVEDKEWLLQHLTRLSDTHESTQALPWKVSDAPKEYIDKMLAAIVGIEIPIAKIVGKWKVNQNRSEADRLGVIAGLTERGDDRSLAMAEMVKRFIAPVK